MQRENSIDSLSSFPSTTTPKSTSRQGGRHTKSLSPVRSMSFYDYENHPDPLYRQAMKKLADGCSRFSKERDGMLLTAFEGTAMDRVIFKDMLRRGLNIRLSLEEIDVIMPIFDRNHNGLCDGEEFILTFYRLRYEHSKKLLTNRIQAEKKILLNNQNRLKKRQEEFELKNIVDVDYDYSDEIKKTALDKLTTAAFKYDRLMPGTVQLNAFDGSIMTPKVFKEQLKHVFNIKLTAKELGALMNYFDRTGSGVINCAEFLVTFYRIGFEERSKYLKKERDKRQKIINEKKQQYLLQQHELEAKNKMKVSYHYTEEEKEMAFRKLRNAARLYDKNTPGAPSLKGFDGAFLEPHVFKEQLRRVFNLKLTPAELGALMHAFDDDGDGTINCAEFTKNFLKLGFNERELELKEMHEKQKLNEEKRRREEMLKYEEQERRNALKVTYEYTEEDFNSAIKKLTDAAWKYDKNMPGAVGLDAFQGSQMEPHVFKEQLKRVFNIHLSPPELGALMSYFDKNGDGTISCAEFLIQFTKVGFEERSRRRQYWAAYEERKLSKKKREAIQKQIQAEQRNALKIEYNYNEEDFHSAIQKLTNAATRYDRSTAGAVGLDAFEGEAMLPHVFKEQLKRVFNIHLSPPELGALMSYFDKNRDGTINCAEFLIQFFRTGFEERSRVRSHWRELKKQRIEKELKYEEDRKKENEQRAMASVDYNFTENEFDSALIKFINMCYRFDQRQLGPAGLIAFQADTVTPSEFREMIKRSFDLIVTPAELGALVTYWDPGMKGRVSCQSFLNSFTQGRVKCEAFKNKPGEIQKLQEYHVQLKEAYKLRIQRQIKATDDNSLRPWRTNAVSQFKTKSAPKKPYPTTPLQKILRRIAVAKKTGRLDLSTQQVPFKPIERSSSSSPSPSPSQSLPSPSSPSSPILNPETTPETEIITKSQFVNQWREPTAPKASEMKIMPSTLTTIEYYLEEIPREIFAITGLTEIWLCNNPLKTIHPSLADFHSLQVLSLANVGLTEIPTEVSGLISLRRLYLQKNKLTNLPEELSSLTLLTDLNLSHNQFTGPLAVIIYQFKQLAYLNISYNNITSIADEITLLSSLCLLDVTDTQVKKLSDNVLRRMPQLLLIGNNNCSSSDGDEGEGSGSNNEGNASPDGAGVEKKKKEKEKINMSSKYFPEMCGISKEEEQELLGFLRHRAQQNKNKK